MNVELLTKIKGHILEEPRRFVMSQIDIHGDPGSPTGLGNTFPECGAAACIAGWACGLSGIPWENAYFKEAAGVLEITQVQAERLFVSNSWPLRFADGGRDDGSKETAELAAARIEHFIATEGAE